MTNDLDRSRFAVKTMALKRDRQEFETLVGDPSGHYGMESGLMAESRRSSTYQQREGQKFRTKYSQLWRDQLDGMQPIARDLQEAKTTPNTPRITENTLIRVAVDVLLEHAHLLAGETEDDIRTNLLAALNRDQ